MNEKEESTALLDLAFLIGESAIELLRKYKVLDKALVLYTQGEIYQVHHLVTGVIIKDGSGTNNNKRNEEKENKKSEYSVPKNLFAKWWTVPPKK